MSEGNELTNVINALNKQYMVKRILVETTVNGGIIFLIQIPFMFKLLYGKSYIKFIDTVVEENSYSEVNYIPTLISTVF